jgi:hypothetical protein
MPPLIEVRSAKERGAIRAIDRRICAPAPGPSIMVQSITSFCAPKPRPFDEANAIRWMRRPDLMCLHHTGSEISRAA